MIQTRIALFYTSSATAGAFSGLLAFAIARMDGIGGLEGWRYIFLLEGAATVALGLTVPFLLVDSPAKSKWLTEDEKRYLTLAVQAQDGGSRQQAKAHGIDWASLKQVLTDWHLYLFCIIYWAGTIPNYGEYGYTIERVCDTYRCSIDIHDAAHDDSSESIVRLSP